MRRLRDNPARRRGGSTMVMTLVDAVHALRAGTLSAREYTARLLARIGERERVIAAWVTLDEARALRLAAECDARRTSSVEPGPLHGVPIGVKDIVATADLPTEMGSPIFKGHRPERDALVVERLRQAGAFVLGKTVTTEFAFMQPGRTRNPWNPAHTPGGSSSGSAAAVAAGCVPLALGTQTNGSVIRPAAFCGVVGFKPTSGLLPYGGTLQFSETLDQVGTFTRTVACAALAAASLAEAESLDADLPDLGRAPRLGALTQFPWNRAEPEMARHFETTLDRLRAVGAVVETVALAEPFAEARAVHRAIMLHEAARLLKPHLDASRHLLSAALIEGLMEGQGVPLDAYRAAHAKRAALIERSRDLFEDFDAIVSPPAPGAAPARLDTTGDPSFCTLWTLLGAPAITLPSGLSPAGVPFGLQLARDAGGDAHLLRVAQWCERVLRFKGLE
jgi:Asp-tRNA(Asn)/Glu-tRNA(Gln) amidotransferase A subunit family amidase